MKKFIMASVIAAMATTATAEDFTVWVLEDSTAHTVAYVVVGMLNVSSDVSTQASAENMKLEAQKIQNDIQAYGQNGIMSVYLADKVNMVQTVNAELSTEDSLDVLILAADSILTK